MGNKILAYCDGGCRNNQIRTNIGGYGVVLLYDDNKKEIFGYELNTTNNRMELLSCIKALETIKDKTIPIEIIMDSQYVISGMNEWINNWVKNNWKNSQKKTIENKDLWEQLLLLKNQFTDIKFLKCKGHSDNQYNNEADRLANKGMDLMGDIL